MDNREKRITIFILFCFTTRLLLAYLASIASSFWLTIMGYLALLPAIGFALIYIFGLRKTGPEVLGGKIWWNNFRPIHSLLYFLFAYNAIINRSRQSYKYLLVDAILGLLLVLFFDK